MGRDREDDRDGCRWDVVVYADAGPFSYDRFTGLSRYTARLVLALKALVPVRFFTGDLEILPPERLSWSQDQDLARWARRVWRSPRRPLTAPPGNSLGLFCTLRPDVRTFPFEVSVLHDFTPLLLPETHLERTCLQFRQFFSSDLLLSDLAVAVSHSTGADASWLTALPDDRLLVAPSGPSLCVGAHASRGRVTRSPRVGLAVSTLEPRKNAEFLLDWFFDTDALPEDAELRWVGPIGWKTSREVLRRPGGRGGRRVRFLGVVSDARLCRLYRRAGWSVYPSLYEGFGFPVLDALRHGTPVLTSYNSSLCEFEGPGVHFIDPCDPATLDDAWRRLRDGGPAAISAGRLDDTYNWARVARAILDAHAERAGAAAGPSARVA